jgi:uncharacterized protein YecE (DUF72 family)
VKLLSYIGTASWNVPAIHGSLFPGGGSHLERYARQLNAVEINSSFYRSHRRTTYERWARSVSDGFRFAIKVPKTITHERRFNDCGNLLDRFAHETAGLGGKLGILLVQLPPSFVFNKTVVARFFEALQHRSTAAIVCEPRHPSWFTPEADALLEGLRVARVASDPATASGAGEPSGSKETVYYRLHGSPHIYHSSYDADALAVLMQALRAHRMRGAITWCIFDNTASYAASENALTLADRERGLP